MKTFQKHNAIFFAFVFLVLGFGIWIPEGVSNDGQVNSPEVLIKKDNHENEFFITTNDLYLKCKSHINADEAEFQKSYCATYIEGYIGGGYSSGLYILSQATNQKEIMEEMSKNKCKNWKNKSVDGPPVKWLAQYFVDWIDKNHEIIGLLNEGTEAFSNREAFLTLRFITTDERFCTKSSTEQVTELK
jgi:hypothetical protein